MADAISGVTEVASTIEQLISTRVQEVLTSTEIVAPTLSDFSDQAVPGIDRVKIPRFSNWTVDNKAENTAVDAQTNSFSTDDLLLDKHQVIQFLLEDIAELQAKVAVVPEYLNQMGRDMGAKRDNDSLSELESGVSTSAPDHEIKYADTGTNVMAKVDILEARKLLDAAKVPKSERFGVVPSDKEKDLMNISEFTRVDEAGSSMALRNGQIGQLFGFVMLSSEEIPTSGAALFYHRTCAATASQMQPKTEKDRDLPNLADRWSISRLWGVKTLDSGKRQVHFTET